VLYTFQEGTGTIVHDVAGVGPPGVRQICEIMGRC